MCIPPDVLHQLYGFPSKSNQSTRSIREEFPEKTSSRDQLLELHLEGTAIRGLPASIELLSGNVLLNLKDCKNLKSRPSTINGLRSLRTLYLSGCSKLKNVPETLGKVESLENRAKMQNDFDYVEQSAVETVTKLAKAESLRPQAMRGETKIESDRRLDQRPTRSLSPRNSGTKPIQRQLHCPLTPDFKDAARTFSLPSQQ
ncbi:hypothetical protein CUMW_246610 [Citrus unshiu]|uniref:Uncharacterized protein n=1 Tax=Citrus unshiu TaxID=55188 RepID=A0A2H5QNG8_CITUN|nr:hypothetical protein CUMW_246610 [Citrus unshiu]